MATEATVPVPVEEKGKGKEPTQETTQHSDSAMSAATATPSPPPVPGKDSETSAPTLPPRPSPADTPLQPLPPSHPGSKGQEWQQQQQQQQPQPFPISYYAPNNGPLEPATVPFNQNWYIIKLVLNTASIIFSAVVIGLGVALASWGGSYSDEEALFAITCSTAGLAVVWTAAEVLTVCLTHKRVGGNYVGIHPGAHVGLHLIIWLLTALSLGTVVVMREDEYSYSSGYWNQRFQTPHVVYQLKTALLAFIILLLLIHFTLFVRACVETHRVNVTNRLNRNRVIHYVPLPVPVDGNAQYYPGVPGAGWPQPYPQMSMMNQAPGQTFYGQPQGNGPLPPQQAVLLGGYYAPTGPQTVPQVYNQPPASTLLQGYYAPSATPPGAPEMHSSSSGSRRGRTQQSVPPPAGSSQ